MSVNSTNAQTQVNKSNFGAELGASIAFSGITSGGFGSITAVKNHGGIRNAYSATRENNKLLKEYAKALGPETDVFTRSIKTAYNYQDFTRLAKQKAKLERKINLKKLPLGERIKNLFRANDKKVKLDDYKKGFQKQLDDFVGDSGEYGSAVKKLKNGESISTEVLRTSRTKIDKKIANLEALKLEDKAKLPLGEKIKNLFRKDKLDIDGYIAKLNTKANTLSADDALEAAKTFKQSTKGLLKSELKDPMGIFFAATEVATRFAQEAIPAFKNEGFGAGLKATGKALAAGIATWATDAGLSVVFRTIGATVGGFLGPVGSAIGSIVGNAVGGLLSCKIIQKIFPTKEQTQEIASVPQQMPQEPQQTQAQPAQQEVASAQTNPIQQQDLTAKYANMPSKDQVKQMAYAQAFQGKGGRFNTYYA